MNQRIAARHVAASSAVALLVVGLFSGCAPAARKTAAPTPTPTRTPTHQPASFPTPTYTPSGTPEPTPTEAPSRTPGPTTSPLVRAFVARITSPTFQFEGTASMSVSFTYNGKTQSSLTKGTIKVKGSDNSAAMTTTEDGESHTSESRTIGTSVYTRTDGGPWTESTRAIPTEQSLFSAVTANQIRDIGVGTFNGRSLHALVLTETYSLGLTISQDGTAISSGNGATLTFWAASDGTPAGMTYRMSTSSDSGSMDITVIYTFDKLSGVTITAPI